MEEKLSGLQTLLDGQLCSSRSSESSRKREENVALQV